MSDIHAPGRGGFPCPPGAIVLPAVSSTRIRQHLRQGEDVSAWVPAVVRDYITRHRLYTPEQPAE